MAAVICGQHLTECFMKYATPEFIQDHFILESLTEIQEKDDLIVLLKDQEEDYFERLLCDLTKHVITSTFNNAQLISQTFRDKLLSFLRKSDVKTVLKSFDTESCIIDNNYDELEYRDQKKHFNTTPLIESATTGYFDIVEFLIVNVKCNVNNTDERGNSPLHKASERGHTAVAKLLLENNADVSQCNNYEMSALYAACAGGHKDTVELLLQNNADVNQCDEDGQSPFVNDKMESHLYMLLVNVVYMTTVNQQGKFRDPNMCYYYGQIRAVDHDDEDTYQGTIETVKLLLAWNADVSLCDKKGQTPLDYAPHHDEELKNGEQDQTTFLETRATHHILDLYPHNCIVVTGSSGCGKSSTIHHAALHLRDSLEYEIIPVLTGPTDIMNYYNRNKNKCLL
ncbi:unnamed protein product [Mytilus edulis]|uniref:Novel STAND NTPase 3 domain-containing protein n=1 Tax=Mytilus edulis TaxID=6550 RepID=A0A8S3VBJ6_MYTED|nr:unnamed protein product [Mytilus edulis]